MSDAVELSTENISSINKDSVELIGSTLSAGKDNIEIGTTGSEASKANAPQLDTLIGVVVIPKTV